MMMLLLMMMIQMIQLWWRPDAVAAAAAAAVAAAAAAVPVSSPLRSQTPCYVIHVTSSARLSGRLMGRRDVEAWR